MQLFRSDAFHLYGRIWRRREVKEARRRSLGSGARNRLSRLCKGPDKRSHGVAAVETDIMSLVFEAVLQVGGRYNVLSMFPNIVRACIKHKNKKSSR